MENVLVSKRVYQNQRFEGSEPDPSEQSTSSHSSYSQYSSRSDASGGSNYRANSNDRCDEELPMI